MASCGCGLVDLDSPADTEVSVEGDLVSSGANKELVDVGSRSFWLLPLSL